MAPDLQQVKRPRTQGNRRRKTASHSEKEREQWEFENYPEGEIKEMAEIYQSRGVGKEDAQLIVDTMAKYPDFFVDVPPRHCSQR